MTPIVISAIGWQHPLQAYGSFYGNPFYFQSMHGKWKIEVARPGQDPVRNPELFYMEGQHADEGGIDIPGAMKEIGKAFHAFTKKYSQQIYSGKYWPDLSPTNASDFTNKPVK